MEKPNLPPHEGEQASRSHGERHEQILTTLDSKVERSVAIYREIESCTLEQSPEQVEQKLERLWQSFAPTDDREQENLDKALEIKEKIANLNLLSLVHQSLQDANMVPPASDKRNQVVKELIENLNNERTSLLETNDESLFLYRIHELLANLSSKNKFTADIKGNPKQTLIAANLILQQGKKLTKKDVVETISDPFGITFVLRDEVYDKAIDNEKDEVVPRSNGIHKTGTPFSFMRQSLTSERRAEVIRHESIHNRTDTLMTHTTNLSYEEFMLHLNHASFLAPITDRGSKYRKLNLSQEALQVALEKMEDLSNGQLMDGLQHELLAEVMNAEERGFTRPPEVEPTALKEGESQPIITFNGYTLATAASRMKDLLTKLDEHGKKTDNENFKSRCSIIKEKLERQWETSISTMMHSLKEAKGYGEDAHIRTHLLLYLLRPTQYRHIPRYLDWKYASETPAH